MAEITYKYRNDEELHLVLSAGWKGIAIRKSTNIMGTTTPIITIGGAGYIPPSIMVRRPSVVATDNIYPYSYGTEVKFRMAIN